MEKTRIRIKNMVCRHCMEAVLGVMRELTLEVSSIRLGEAEVNASEAEIDFPRMEQLLNKNGFELLRDRELQLVEQIKTEVIKNIRNPKGVLEVKNSIFLSEKLGVSYTYLSKLFSKHEQLTIEKYTILQKIERVKELLSYEELTLSEIAYLLAYSSVQHLSNQFRSVTGMSVSQFKKLEVKERKPINEV